MLVDGSDGEAKPIATSDKGEEIPAAITDTGCERELNEDRYAVVESPSGLAWLVCDGMGGTTGGELAAQLAIDAIRRDLETLPARKPEVALRGAVLEANRIIVLRRQNQAFAQMGTTIVAALFNGLEVVIGNAGDSRAYLIRDGAIQQLTHDHTFVQELVDKGKIDAKEALSHPQAHILTRCVGSEPGLEIDVDKYWIWQVADGETSDLLLLCTDGLYSLISEAELAREITSSSPQRACVKLVELAKARGGYDNITLAIVPLGGQLKKEPPIGYVEPKIESTARTRGPKSSAARRGTPTVSVRGLFHTFVIVVLLSVLAALLTIVGMAMSMG